MDTLCEWLKLSILLLGVLALVGAVIAIGHWIYLARQAVRQSRENRQLHEQVAAIFAVLQDDWVQFIAWRERRRIIADAPITAMSIATRDANDQERPTDPQRAIPTPRP